MCAGAGQQRAQVVSYDRRVRVKGREKGADDIRSLSRTRPILAKTESE